MKRGALTGPGLAARLREAAEFKGAFRLRSGVTAARYFDKFRFEAEPALLKEVAQAMAPLVPEGTEVLAGLELGGVPLAVALGLETGLPMAFVRKLRKAYGTQRIAEGADIGGRRVAIVEDVITTGGQVAMSALDLRGEGARVRHVLCAIYRGDEEGTPKALADMGLEMTALFRLPDLTPANER